MKKLTLSSIALFTMFIGLISCSENSREAMLIGKWQNQKMDKASQDTIGEHENGIKIIFSKDGTCSSIKGEDQQWKGTYALIDNGQSITTHMSESGQKDTIKIFTLTKSILQIETPGKDTAHFQKIEL